MPPIRFMTCLRHCGLLLSLTAFAGIGVLPVGAQIGSGSGSGAPIGSAAAATAPDSVSGRVINAASGVPVPRALVRLNDRAVLTDHEGKFRFEQNTESRANILVTKPGFYATADTGDPGNMYLQGAQLGAPLEIRIYPEALLTGTVTAPDGTPLPRVAVMAARSVFNDTGHQWNIASAGQTDSRGNFRLTVPPGEYKIETRYTPQDRTTGEAVLPVTYPDGNSSNTSQSIRIHAGEEQHFQLRPGVSPTHKITLTMQRSSAGRGFMRITAHSSDGSSLQVNASGNGGPDETTIQLPQGTYVLSARMNGGDTSEEAETKVTVPDHDISGVVLQFSPTPSIPVELVVEQSPTSDKNQPTLQQLGLTLQSERTDIEPGEQVVRLAALQNRNYAFTVPAGSYRLQGRNSGSWYIKSVSYGASDLLQQELVVAPGAGGTPIRVAVSDQMSGLQGTVTLKGNPWGCWVYLIPTGPSAQAVYSLRSNAEGGYTSAYLPPGSYQAVAFEQRYSANFRDPASLAAFTSYVHSVSVSVGDKPTLNLEAVPVAEVTP